eukprot:tig00000113_g5578.t1
MQLRRHLSGQPARALAALAALLLLASASAQHNAASGCWGTQEAACSVTDAASARQGLRRCNFLNDVNLDWIGEDTRGAYPAAAWNSTLWRPSMALARQPFQLGRQLFLDNDTVFYIDADPTQGTKVFALHSEGFGAVFQPYAEILAQLPKDDPFGFDFAPPARLDKVYQQSFPERRRLLRLDSSEPRHLSAHGDAVVWTERRGNGTDVTYFDRALGIVAPLSLRPLPPGASRLEPSACGPYIAYSQFDPARGTSAVHFFHRGTGSSELATPVHPPTRIASFFHPVMDRAPDGFGACALAWAEVSARVSLDPSSLALSEPSGGLGVTLALLSLPERAPRSFPPAAYASGPFVRLENFALSGGTLVAQLSTADRSSWMLRAYSLAAASWRDLPLTKSAHPLALQAASAGRFLYTEAPAAGASTLRLLDPSSVPRGEPPLLCAALDFEPGSVLAVSLDRTLLAWASPLPGGGASLHRLALDKDGDGLLDVEDRFPLLGAFTRDSDNDGIADEADLVVASGPCVTSGTLNACPSDYAALYSVYGSLVALLTASGVAAFRIRAIRRRRQLAARDRQGHRLHVPHIFRFRGNAEIKRYLGPAAAASLALANAEDDATLPKPDIRQLVVRVLRGVFEAFILLVICFSVLLAIAPWLPYAQQIKERHALLWTDLFVSTFIGLDLTARIVYRDRGRQPSVLHFAERNWFEFPALITDLPGVTVVFSGSYQGVPGLVSLLVVLRTLKVTRVMRMYYRVSRNRRVALVVADRPFLSLAVFMFVLVLLAALSIKTHEQYASPGFETVWGALWFVFVTATTVGYGDLVTKSTWGRALAIFVASLGIGMLAVLLANAMAPRSVRLIDPSGATSGAAPSAFAPPPEEGAPPVKPKESLTEVNTNLPVESMLGGGGGGKFKMHELKGQQNYARNTRRRKQVALLKGDADVAPETVLAVVLRYYGLYADCPNNTRVEPPFAMGPPGD